MYARVVNEERACERLGASEIMHRRTGTSKVTVWRWQERFMTGVDGLLRDKTRPFAHPAGAGKVHERTVALMLASTAR
jgi:hypothetical protein